MNRFFGLCGLLAALAAPMLSGCGSTLKYQPRPTSKAPEADVKIAADILKDTGQTRLDISVAHLAMPDRLASGASSFVAWYRGTPATPWVRIGTLKYDAGSRDGELKQTTVPEIAFELQITDESAPAPGSPSSDVIFAQMIGR